MPKGVYERKRKKGKWSRIARAKHSARLKERWAAKKMNRELNSSPVLTVTIPKTTVQDRLNTIAQNIDAIKKQLGV